MATLATVTSYGNVEQFNGGIGVNAADVVVQTGDVSRFDTFMVRNGAGAVEIVASLDGTNYDAPLSLDDLGATTSAPVIVTVAGRTYRVRGSFMFLRVRQNGATAATGVTLLCARQTKAG